MKKISVMILVLLMIFSSFLLADSTDLVQILKEIFPVASPTGYEESMISKIMKLLPEGSPFERDSLGSLYVTRGEGAEHLAVLAGVDEVGFIVSGFDDRGYLTLDMAVPAPHMLYDSFPFGHPMKIWTEKGPVAGVLTLPSLHIVTREIRNNLQNVFSLENAFVDIGVNSEEEARAKGVEMLDPVTPLADMISLAGEKNAGPSLGTKACTSVLLKAAAEILPAAADRKITFVWMAQTKFPARRSRPRAALGAQLAKRNLPTARFLVVDVYPVGEQSEERVSLGKGPVLVNLKDTDSSLIKKIRELASFNGIALQSGTDVDSSLLNPFLPDKNAVGVFIPVKFSATPNEVVDFRDLQSVVKIITSLLQ